MSIVLILIACVVAAAVVYLMRLPATYTVRRSAVMNGPSDAVFEWVRDFGKWQQWSPWVLHDPQTVISYEGDPRAEGGGYGWRSSKIGEGQIHHLRIQPGQSLEQKLRFLKPFKSEADVRFDFQPTANGQTEVTWSMSSQLPLFMRPFCAMFERMVGQDFELGLSRMAGCVDPHSEHPRLDFEGEVDLPAQRIAAVAYHGPLTGLSDFMGPAYARLLQDVGGSMTGHALAAYDKVDIKRQSTQGCAALPVNDAYLSQDPQIHIRQLPGGRYYRVRLQGHYRFLPAAWHASMGHVRMEKRKFDSARPALEAYPNDMRALPNSNDWVTELYVPIK